MRAHFLTALLTLSTVGIFGACGDDGPESPARQGQGGSCEQATPVDLSPERIPARIAGDTLLLEDDLNLVACQERVSSVIPGQGSGDAVFQLRSDRTALYRFTLESAWPGPTALALTRDCEGFGAGRPAACLASTLDGDSGLASVPAARGQAPFIEATLEADTDYFLVVDGLLAVGRPDEGPFEIRIGCGCDALSTCTPSGACRPRQEGDSCDSPIELIAPEPFNAPLTANATTVGQPDGHLAPAACTEGGHSFGRHAGDRIFAFTAPEAGIYRVEVEGLPVEGQTAAALGLAAFAGCTTSSRGASCVAAAPPDASGVSALTLELGAGDRVHLAVDGIDGAEGPFRLSVHPPCIPRCEGCGDGDGCGRTCACEVGEYCLRGVCAPDTLIAGNTCDNPHSVPSLDLPFEAHGDISPASGLGAAHDALGCPGVAATGAHVADEVWSFIAPEDGDYEVLVRPLSTQADLLVALFAGGGCEATGCVGYADEVAAPSGAAETIRFSALSGERFAIVVSAWRPAAAGPYELLLRAACPDTCAGSCGGEDGCGGVCACGPGLACFGGSCQPASIIEGNTCDNPRRVPAGALPVTYSGDLGAASPLTPAHSAASCDGHVTGGSARDEVWSFVATSPGVYEVSAWPTSPDGDLMLYAMADAACAESCLAFSDAVGPGQDAPETITLTAHTAGETFRVIVDAWRPHAELTYAVRFERRCETGCDGLTCGQDDGCGGLCGCGAEDACRAGACVNAATLPGNGCAAPFLVELDAPGAGDLRDADASDTFTASGCPGAPSAAGAGGADQVWRFTAPHAGRFELSAAPVGPAADLLVYALSGDCAAGQCVAFADRAATSVAAEVIELTASFAGQVFHVIVDTHGGAGAYTLTARPACTPSCEAGRCGAADGCGGRCGCAAESVCRFGFCEAAASAAGNSCAAPNVLVGLAPPYVGQGDLLAFDALRDAHHATSCAAGATGRGAVDEVWRFTAPAAGTWEVTVSPEPGGPAGDLIVYAWDTPGCGGSCVAWVDDAGPEGVERLRLEAAAPGDYFWVVVDSWMPHTGDRYTLRIDRPCTPSCAAGTCGSDGCGGQCRCTGGLICAAGSCQVPVSGDTCAVAVPLEGSALPLTASGDVGPNSGRTDALPASLCGARPSGSGRDQIFRFQPQAPGRYALRATPAAGADVALSAYAGLTCGAGCDAFADAGGPGQAETVVLVSDGLSPIWIGVEAVGTSGAFSLSVGLACEPTCGAGCGQADGCGGTCGCEGSEVCVDATCEPATSVPGNTCATARPLPEVHGRFIADGDNGLGQPLGDDLHPSRCEPGFPGQGGLDEIWRFTPPSSGAWDVTLRAATTADLVLYALGAEGGLACQRCLGLSDADILGGGVETLRLTDLAANVPVHLVVDAFSAQSGGPYTLEVRRACDPACEGASCGQDDGCGGACPCPVGQLCDPVDALCDAPLAVRGNSCEVPRVVAAGEPVDGDLAASVYLDDQHRALGCPDPAPFDGAGGPDEVFVFTASRAGLHTFRVTPSEGADPMLYLLDGSGCDGACLGVSDRGGRDHPEVIERALAAGQSVLVVVDTWSRVGAGPYVLEVEAPR